MDSKHRRLLRRVARWLLVGLALSIAFVAATNVWILQYASEYIAHPPRTPPSTVIVPGALVRGLEPSQTLKDRLICAKQLVDSGRATTIVVSGDHGRQKYDEVAAMRHWLESEGVQPAKIVDDHAGFRTLDTMERARHVFGVKRAYICTQEFHLDRAVFLARRAGIEAYGVAADRMRYAGHRWNQVRETLARSAAFVDSYILRTGPRFL